jgi:hypothetical protein
MHLQVLSEILVFDEALKYDNSAKCGHGTRAERLCLQFCNVVQCQIFVKYLTR